MFAASNQNAHQSAYRRIPSSNQPRSVTAAATKKFWFIVLSTAIPSFLLGTNVSLYLGVARPSNCACGKIPSNGVNIEEIVQLEGQESLKEREKLLQLGEIALRSKQDDLVNKRVEQKCGAKAAAAAADSRILKGDKVILDSGMIGDMVAGMTVTSTSNFTQVIDLGVPLDKATKGASQVLMLYSRVAAMPTALQNVGGKQTNIPEIRSQESVENCDILNVLLVDHSKGRNQCLALVPQYEAYHLQHFMRIRERRKGLHVRLNSSEPLRLVSRGLTTGGIEEFNPPNDKFVRLAFEMLKTYFNSLEHVKADLKTVISSSMTPYNGRIITVMVCNFGQSELLMNFVCHAKSKGFDLSSVLVFATDQETADLAKSLGLAAYYDKYNFGDVPIEAAKEYGDRRFQAMMIAKVLCVQLISLLGYDLLFQDVDILWYQHPLKDYFAKPGHWSKKYDVIFQHDGARSSRYTPYSANSGFYFVRNNRRTRSLVDTLLTSSATIFQDKSHQQALITILSEHVSLYGLTVKVVNRDEDDLPGGFNWNKKKEYMKQVFNGEMVPVIFHMSWTLNKDNKIKYFQQMGTWFVEDKCIAKKKSEINETSENLISTCCAAEPIFTCHYKDKPSIHPCKDSPSIDKGRSSFW